MNMVRKIAENINTSQEFIGKLQYNISMKEHTTFKVGGPAEIYITPKTVKSFCFVIRYLQQEKQPYFILGEGSNIVVSEKGISGFVISTAGLNTIEYNKRTNELICGAGCTFSSVTQFCIKNSLSGLEAFAGLPASTGGAVFMNARCYEKSISDILVSVDYVTNSGLCKSYLINLADWDYKVSPFKTMAPGIGILAIHFKVHTENKELIKAECQKNIKNRLEKGHYKFPSAGSVFKNNRAFGKTSGQLIDEAGLKGITCGGAQIAPWHGNFIVNTGNATADDIKKLVEQASQTVKAQTGFQLECEIIFCGD
jgi:UDP-N-acetylmuramate dehydrogenase